MILFFSPLSGKAEGVADYVIRHLNSLLTPEKIERVFALEPGDHLVLIWDYPENQKKYSSVDGCLFVPFSREAENLWFRRKPVSPDQSQNFKNLEHDLPMLFPVNREAAGIADLDGDRVLYHADWISQLFILLTGWNELFSERDALGRVLYSGSLAARLNSSGRALAEETIACLVTGLHSLGVPASFALHDGHSWRVTLTHDLDHLKKWTTGYWIRRILIPGSSKQGNPGVWQEYRRHFASEDPYQTSLKEIIGFHDDHQSRPVYFLRAGKSDKRDSRIDFKDPLLAGLRKRATENQCRIGLHPTIRSASDPEQFFKDWTELQAAIPETNSINRQHFLMFDPAVTPSVHHELHIKEDYTLGFHDHEGLRRNSVHPFQGFDLTAWKLTDTWYIPLIAMDATFTDYRKVSAEEALSLTTGLLREVKTWQGHVSLLFHNSFTRQENPDWWAWFGSTVAGIRAGHGLLA